MSWFLGAFIFGVAKQTKDMTFEAAYRNADKALYRVKQNGCGVAIYSETPEK